MGTRRLGIKITTSFDGGGSKKAKEEISGLSKSMGQLGKISAAVGAAGLLLKIGQDAIQTASDIQEMRSKFDTVFGSSADSVTSQLQNFADVANRSIFDLQGFAAGFQDTFVPLGFARERAAGLSVELVKLTEDLASFNNVASSDVSANLSSALVGNHEAVRSFGIVITETTLKAELAANGWNKLTGSALEQAKVQARLNIIMRSTADAHNDATRTADSYANQVKGLEAAWKDFLVTLGSVALPTATATVEELSEKVKILAERLAPVVSAVSGEYGDAVEGMIGENIEAAKSIEDLIIEGQKLSDALGQWGGLASAVTFTEREMRDGVNLTARAIAGQTDTVEDFAEAIDIALRGRARQAFQQHLRDLGLTQQEYYRLVEASKAVEDSDRAMLGAAQSVNFQIRANGDALSFGSGMADQYAERARAMAEENHRAAVSFAQSKEMVQAHNAALASAFRETEGPIQAFLDAQQLAIDSQGTWVQTTRDNSGQLSEISAQLAADLDDDQRKAYQEILNTTAEGSAEWLAAWKALQADLTASQRAELIAQSADLQAAQGEMGSAYTGSIADMRAAKDAAIEANVQMVQSYQNLALEGSLALAELSPDPEAIQRTLDYAVAIGAMTQKEADLRLEAANTRLAIEELNQKVVEGDITAEQAAIAFEQLVNGHKRVSVTSRNLKQDTEDIGGAFTGILGPIDEVIGRLNSLDGRTVRTRVEVNTVDNGGSGGGGGKTEGKAFGGAVFPGRDYVVGERGPEVFRSSSPGTIIPNNQMMGSGMGKVTIQVYQQPGESGELLANRISQILAKRARQIRTAGG